MQILQVIAPIVLGYLGKQKRQQQVQQRRQRLALRRLRLPVRQRRSGTGTKGPNYLWSCHSARRES